MELQNETPHRFVKAVGENIKKRRKKKNVSLEELGLRIGISRMDMHRIERGYNITLITILKISLALNISAEKLLKVVYLKRKDELEILVNMNKSNRKKGNGK